MFALSCKFIAGLKDSRTPIFRNTFRIESLAVRAAILVSYVTRGQTLGFIAVG